MVSDELFQQTLGSLLYLALRTRPDILVAVLILAQFQNAPTAYCHRGDKRILRYPRGTVNVGLSYYAGGLDLSSCVDSDYAGGTIDPKSMSGYVVKHGKALVMRARKRQTAVALSTC